LSGLCAIAALGIWTSAVHAQATEVKEKPRMYTYFANWEFPRARWGDFEKATATTQKVLDQAIGSGALVGYGDDAAVVHQAEGPTHDNWWSALSQAAVLDVKLKHLNTWHEARRHNAALYDSLFAKSKVKTPKIDAHNYSIYNQYVVRVSNRDAVKEHLTKAGVGCAVYYPLPLHQQECFMKMGVGGGSLPESERASKEVLALPIYPELKEEEIRYVAKCVLEAVK